MLSSCSTVNIPCPTYASISGDTQTSKSLLQPSLMELRRNEPTHSIRNSHLVVFVLSVTPIL